MVLSNRTYPLHQALQAIRTQPTLAGRRTGLAALRQLVVADQAALEQAVANNGGTVERRGNQVTTTVGHVPILGLVEVSAPGTWEPRLEVFMEPWSANSATTTQLEWRLSRAPGLVGWVLAKGDWSPSPVSFPPCSSWLVNPETLAVGFTTVHGLAGGTLAVLPHVIHAEVGLQVALTSSLFSNAVRVTVGGGL